jgi:UDP-N-acetylmuramate--alanine ligase
MDAFAVSFAEGPADFICILPVYAASEEPIPGADHEALVERIRAKGHANVEPVTNRAEGVARMAEWVRAGDTILTQGAGDVTFAGPDLLAAIASRVPELPRERAAAS